MMNYPEQRTVVNNFSNFKDTATQEERMRLSHRDLLYCKNALNHGSKSFLAASYLLPRQMRCAATALYAFCREADDLIDLGDDQAHALTVVRERVEAVYGHRVVDNPADRALQCVVRHYDLPKTLLDALIDGFAWDASERCYQTLEEVEDYGARVAGTVGAMMSLLMGARDPSIVARACDLGVAMQLTNICRDVGEDARAGRCYLPIDWLEQAGVTTETLLHDESAVGVHQVVRRLLNRAEHLYRRADTGISQLPKDCQRGIRMARHLYAAIGREVEQLGPMSINARAWVPKSRKLKLLAQQWFSPSPYHQKLMHKPPLVATEWLVDAVTNTSPDEPVQVYTGLVEHSSSTESEMVSVLNLIDRLEHTKKTDLQANSGKVPFGFAGVVRH